MLNLSLTQIIQSKTIYIYLAKIMQTKTTYISLAQIMQTKTIYISLAQIMQTKSIYISLMAMWFAFCGQAAPAPPWRGSCFRGFNFHRERELSSPEPHRGFTRNMEGETLSPGSLMCLQQKVEIHVHLSTVF